jgi:hypothetical protein
MPGTLLGLLLIVVCASGVAVFTASAGRRRAVLLVVRPVKVGAVIQDADVGETRVSVDTSVHVVPVADRSAVVGHVAAANLVPGTLVSLDALAAGPRLSARDAVVGLALKPGLLPSELHPLDVVMLVRTAGTAATDGGATPGNSGAPAVSGSLPGAVLVPNAQVFSVDQSTDGQTTDVSVIVSTAAAPAVASASAADEIGVVRVGGGSP